MQSQSSKNKALYSAENIVAGRNPAVQIGALDGQVGAQLHHQGTHYIITTPNQDYVPLPPIGQRDLRLRSDLRFGLEDHTQWPQFHVMNHPHLFAILRRPYDDSDVLGILWWNPTERDLISSKSCIVNDMGEIAPDKLKRLVGLKESLEIAVAGYLSTHTGNQKPSDRALDVLHGLQIQMGNSLERLSCLKTSYTEMVFNVTEFQRHYLTLDAMLRYGRIFKERLNGSQPPPQHPDTTILGAFTMNADVAQHFFRAGVPVWFVQEWDGEPLTRNVLHVVDVAMPTPPFRFGKHDPPFPTIFQGLMTDARRFEAICTYSLKRQLSPDPFVRGEAPSSNNPPASVAFSSLSSLSFPQYGGWGASTSQAPHYPLPGSSASSSQTANAMQRPPKRRREATEKVEFTGRNKFQALEDPCAPFSIPAWANALSSVDCSPSKIVDPRAAARNSNQYVFPDPGLFVSSKHRDKYLINWLQLRFFWYTFIGKEDGTLSPQDWRHLLYIDLVEGPPEGQSVPAKRWRELFDKLRYSNKVRDGNGGLVAQAITAPDNTMWNGVNVEVPIPNETAREILWSLYEFNFTYELISLDRRACLTLGPNPTPEELDERQIKIRLCFETGHFMMPAITANNVGLASDDLTDRLPFLVELGKVIHSWMTDPPPILGACNLKNAEARFGKVRGLELEATIAQIYCQTFWNHFGRAAQIPHRLHRA